MKQLLIVWMLVLLCLISAHAFAADARFCGVVYRNATTHEIIRSRAVVNAFKREWPCIAPCNSTWQVDHTIPLKVGGCDSVENMSWMSPQIKTCAIFCKDRFEMLIYGNRPFITVYK